MRKCYTYDDINIIPKYSDIEHRDEINISTNYYTCVYHSLSRPASHSDWVYAVMNQMMLANNDLDDESKIMKAKQWKRIMKTIMKENNESK